MKMASHRAPLNIIFLAFFLSQLCPTYVSGLQCFQCLTMDCKDTDRDCKEIRSFIQSELKLFYYFDTDLEPCPPADIRYSGDWRKLQDPFGEICPEDKPGEATCTLGRMQIESREYNRFGEETAVKQNYATVLGCAKRLLLTRIKDAYAKIGNCDYAKFNQSSPRVFRQLEIGHCRDITRLCHEEDYCINWKDSEVKRWPRKSVPSPKYDFSTIMSCLGVLALGISAIFICGLYWNPRASSSSSSHARTSHCLARFRRVDSDRETLVSDASEREMSPMGQEGKINPETNQNPTPPPPPSSPADIKLEEVAATA